MTPNKPTTLREEFRKKFGQFYVSIHKDGTPRLVDTEGGEKVIATDTGEELRVFASTTQENWWLTKFSAHSTELISKYEVKFMFEKSGQCSSLHRAHPETEWEKGWNSAVEAMLKYLPQPSLEEYNQVISLINQEK